MPDLLALLDLGSNAARFLLASIEPGVGYRVLRAERVQTRLGGGPRGKLPVDAIELTLASIHRFLGSLGSDARPDRVMAIATAAVREAANRDHLIEALRRREGVQMRLLSGPEEAHLGALAALRSLPLRRAIIADLGGGSLQLARVDAEKIHGAASLPLGAVGMTRRFLREDPPTLGQVRALRQALRDRLLGVLPPAGRGEDLVGLGGTVRALARLHLIAHAERRKGRHGLRLEQSDVTAIRARLEALPLRKRRRVRGLKPERADIILAGAIAIEELMVFGGYFTLTVCSAGVRDGVLWREALNGRA
jgi:exopolyphosphatase/guanosine-5'-triphosphate,3'-diphosphate pyrophosphatase